MNTISKEVCPGRRRRRKHNAEFKAQVVAACRPGGVSIAAVAMAHGVNANLARRWVLSAERGDMGQPATCESAVVPSFMPLRLPSAEPAPADIRIELRRGSTTINVCWPGAAAAECAAWMRELLR
ncbi:transposase [Piscinibacter sp.]|uniref:transposase n=1 Tax=Piscinibacter sp. TaxID=1903157 RepID=UPI002CB0EF34|nr:transposase [Albitalea sp.]HUG22716.1 transposase [Albitalea sp.]